LSSDLVSDKAKNAFLANGSTEDLDVWERGRESDKRERYVEKESGK